VDFVVDLDPKHRVLRITVTTALTDKSCAEIYQAVARLASRGGPYAAITDLSQVADFPVSSDAVKALAAAAPAIPLGGRLSVIVARQPALFGIARMFELSRDSMGGQLQVVQSLDEAYNLLKVTPQDFSERLLPIDVAT
jgi:anti-anti-sigma regulatory factor